MSKILGKQNTIFVVTGYRGEGTMGDATDDFVLSDRMMKI